MIVFFGVLALLGAHTVNVSDKPVTGIAGLIAALIMAPLLTAIFSLFGWIGAYIGIRVWGHFQPTSLEYVAAYNANAVHSIALAPRNSLKKASPLTTHETHKGSILGL